MSRIRISLANKCQLLFGAAALLIICSALAVLWIRMSLLITEVAREKAWDRTEFVLQQYEPDRWTEEFEERGMRWVPAESIFERAEAEPFIAQAMLRFSDDSPPLDYIQHESSSSGGQYHYARVVRTSDLSRGHGDAPAPRTAVAAKIHGLVVWSQPTSWAQRQLNINLAYAVVAGLVSVLLAIVSFWVITSRIILRPVKVLHDTAEKVAEGDLNIRTDINTRDEFEQLSQTFNTMLSNLKSSQDRMRELNKQLDLKLGELAESNLSLFEANRVKGDFLANVSHELRTPLNSIIGFAEVLGDSMEGLDAASEKRRRYVENILTSSRALLALITELLDLATIEAGRVDLHVETMSVVDTCEVLGNLIRPQADQKEIQLRVNVDRSIPVVETDPGKFQQILFNFLSNAIKFTPPKGRIELGAIAGRDAKGQVTSVRIWVSDNGPGVPDDRQKDIFEKFHQLDNTHTREHGGAGLGLAISQELARLLQGRIELDSEVDKGSKFTLIIPLAIEDEEGEALLPESQIV